MNKHTRKKYPNAVREITVYEGAPKPEGKVVSLFEETTRRVSKLEMQVCDLERELAAEKKHSAALEKALIASREVNAQAIKLGFRRIHAPADEVQPRPYIHPRNINALSDEETEQLFAQLSVPDDYVSCDTVERLPTPWRERVLAPMCALFRRAQ